MYCFIISPESAELVKCQESMGHVPDMSSDIHHLHRICHLHRWDPSITSEFHVSTVAATVSLTLFVGGYGLG